MCVCACKCYLLIFASVHTYYISYSCATFSATRCVYILVYFRTLSRFITMHSLTGCLVWVLNFRLWHIMLLFCHVPKASSRVTIQLADALSWAPCLWSRPSGQDQARGQIYKKVREQLSLKCQILWPEPWWNREIAKQIDTQTRYGKVEQRRGGAARGPQGVTWKANSMFQILVGNQPKKGNQKAANVRFCIPFNKLFWVSVTQGKCMLAKRSAAGKEWKESKREPAAHVIDLFFSIWAKKKKRMGGKQGSHL